MIVDEETKKFGEIFKPGYEEVLADLDGNDLRFAYYTDSATAIKIISNGELWFRNTTVMNDVSEISYGLGLIKNTFSGSVGSSFQRSVEDMFPGTLALVDGRLKGWMLDWQLETYIACVSSHDDGEDESGRLSMWRAYGDTALIFRNTPLLESTDELAVHSFPVMYLSEEGYRDRLDTITGRMIANREYLMGLGQEKLVEYIQQMLFDTAIATKHPGFAEEKEWRLFYRPNQRRSPLMEKRIEVLSGVPQIVYSLTLTHDPKNGMVGADIPSLLERIIIGPTDYPYVSARAFESLLEGLGIDGERSKVVSSDIPLRPG